jgi:hypothetical protein
MGQITEIKASLWALDGWPEDDFGGGRLGNPVGGVYFSGYECF